MNLVSQMSKDGSGRSRDRHTEYTQLQLFKSVVNIRPVVHAHKFNGTASSQYRADM